MLGNHVPLTGEVARIAGFLDGCLPGRPRRARRLGGEVTTEPDAYEFPRGYAAFAAWPHVFRDFGRAASDGFICG